MPLEFLNDLASKSARFFVDGSQSLYDSIGGLSQSIRGLQLLESKYKIRIGNIDSAISSQQETIDFLQQESSDAYNGPIVAEIANLKEDLAQLQSEKEKLQKELDQFRNKEIKAREKAQEGKDESFEKYIDELRDLVADNESKMALKMLLERVKKDCALYNEVVLVSARLRSLEQQRRLDLMSSLEFNNLHNRLVWGLLEMLDQIDKNDVHLESGG